MGNQFCLVLQLSALKNEFPSEGLRVFYKKHPAGNQYLQVVIAKTESLIQLMRWKAFFFLNKNCNDTSKESYGFKSKRSPPHVAELNEFEGCMLEMIQRVEFRTNTYSNDHRRTGRGGEGGCSPPKFWATQIFWAARENLGKVSF